jgi:PAS domain S-box-containing protein
MPNSDGPFWTLFNSLPVGAVLFDPDDDGFVEFNDAACEQLGYSREQFSRLRVGDVDTLRSGEEIQQARKQLRPGTRPQRFHTRQRAADGHFKEVDVTLQCIRVNGRNLGYAVWHDVTEREHALSALRAREAELARVQRIGRIGGYEIDLRDGFHNYRSPEYLTLHRLPPESANETHDAWVRRLHPEDRERIDRVFRETVAGEATDYAAEYRVIMPDGETRWISAIAEIERDPQGRALRMVGAHIDVTDLRQAESTLASHAARLEEADRRKDEFLAMLGHELRNPLAPILSVSEMLRRRQAAFATDVASAHEVIDRQARHLQILVDELLDVARITTGRIALTEDVVPIRGVVLGAVEQAQDLITRQGHRFYVDTEALPDRLFVKGDLARLVQVVSNLLNNAAKYTDPGGAISLTVTFDDAEVSIAVRDSGIGIPAEALPHIFDRFGQFDRNLDRSRSGLGIGLILSNRLVALHGGRIAAYSGGAGKGSLFTVHLPRHFAPSADAAVSVPDAAPLVRTEAAPQEASRRVLMIDDNVDAAEAMAMLLKMDGHEVLVLHDGMRVVQQARSFRPDIALLDLGLPGRDGFQIAQDLRGAPDLEGLVLIAVTGYGQEEDRRRTRESGFAFHLTKPVDFAELAELLATAR